ncbi:MAG: CapA family protein, partial [Gemmatimonadetes bacterium]|nr:CapA family protein [Gemmatimonadota bacterium]
PKVFHFGAPPEAVEVLRAAGIRLVCLAINHVLDFEEQGLFDTLAHLDAAGIARAGAGPDAAEAARPAVLQAGGVRVGLIAFTDNEPDWEAEPGRPGVNYMAIQPEPRALARVGDAAAAARSMGAEFVILSLHWGPNMVERPPAQFREFAHGALQRGVDLVHGHSAHIFQGVELSGSKPILYDTGDFLDDYAVDPMLRNDHSFLFLLELDEGRARQLRMLPVRLQYARVDLARGAELEEILERMLRLSAELGTALERAGGELRLGIRAAPDQRAAAGPHPSPGREG